MADEVEMTPVAAEPPKADPLAKPAAPLGGGTLKLNPIVRKPAASGATVSALRPGLKLPPKPGATISTLRPGLKLPPKPGATVSALKPGLKLPPKPGATVSALKPGLKLPPKPVIHKPGEAVAEAPLPKPVTPIAPAASDAAPKTEAPAAAPQPPTSVPVDSQGVGKLPTVEAQSISREAVTPPDAEIPKPMEQLKSVTQKLKGITQQIPQQAILRKTGIIADAAMSEAQKEAAKHKTARISLSDAMGVAPVKDEHAPMKTIRIKRPIDIPTAAPAPAPKAEPPPAPTAAAEPAPSAPSEAIPAAPATPAAASLTQRKTLRIARPGSAVRPAGKFGLKRPSEATTLAKPAPAAAPEASEAAAPVADIADIPEMPPMAAAPSASASPSSGGPTWLWSLSALVQLAACVAMGALAWFLYENTQTQYF